MNLRLIEFYLFCSDVAWDFIIHFLLPLFIITNSFRYSIVCHTLSYSIASNQSYISCTKSKRNSKVNAAFAANFNTFCYTFSFVARSFTKKLIIKTHATFVLSLICLLSVMFMFTRYVFMFDHFTMTLKLNWFLSIWIIGKNQHSRTLFCCLIVSLMYLILKTNTASINKSKQNA